MSKSANKAIVDMPFSPQRWLVIYDNEGRLSITINVTMDMGDAREHADDP